MCWPACSSAARLAYTAAYIFDKPALRSAIWGLGFLCVILLFCAGLYGR